MQSTQIKSKRWKRNNLPKRILVIRLQATGDMMLTLPFIKSIKEQLPYGARVDFLVREEVESIPKSLDMFDHVYSIRGGRNSYKQLLFLLFMLPKLFINNYHAVLDLQNNKISKIARKLLFPYCWVEFDRISPVHATERYKNTLLASGFLKPVLHYEYKFINPELGLNKLKLAGWQNQKLILINPAGAFETRNWPIENYVAFCRKYLNEIDPNAKFLIMGLPKLASKAQMLKAEIGEQLINLVGETTPAEVFSIIQNVYFTLSEDGAIMHMSYLSKVPTICMIGSVREDWTDPCLSHTYCFHSDDLPCGNCMASVCKLGNNLCMVRVTPEMVIEQAKILLANHK